MDEMDISGKGDSGMDIPVGERGGNGFFDFFEKGAEMMFWGFWGKVFEKKVF
jgi:hypothetical protein